MHGDVEPLLQRTDEVLGHVGRQQPGHVLHRQHVGAGVHQLLGEVHEVLRRMNRADGVRHRRLQGLAGALDRVHGGFHVADVVHGVEYAEDVDAVLCGLLHEGLDGVVGVVAVADDVLAAQQHLQSGIGHGRADQSQALPGTFVKVTQAGVEGGSAPHLYRPESDLVDLRRDGQHVLGAHARGQQGLMRVPEHGFHDPDFLPFHQFLPGLFGGRGMCAPAHRK